MAGPAGIEPAAPKSVCVSFHAATGPSRCPRAACLSSCLRSPKMVVPAGLEPACIRPHRAAPSCRHTPIRTGRNGTSRQRLSPGQIRACSAANPGLLPTSPALAHGSHPLGTRICCARLCPFDGCPAHRLLRAGRVFHLPPRDDFAGRRPAHRKATPTKERRTKGRKGKAERPCRIRAPRPKPCGRRGSGVFAHTLHRRGRQRGPVSAPSKRNPCTPQGHARAPSRVLSGTRRTSGPSSSTRRHPPARPPGRR